MAKIQVDVLTEIFIKIRDKRAEVKAAHKKIEEELESQMDTIKQALLKHCKDEKVESVRTTAGLFYRTLKTRYWASDWASMYKFIAKHEVPEFFEKRLNQSVVKTFVEENPNVVPDGLNVDSEYILTVKK
jgi:phage pi2 protein 07|tara:strand:+ start:10751 stop:11140 length:390 start_codon:yes stop_codon:yes gene_type:complete